MQELHVLGVAKLYVEWFQFIFIDVVLFGRQPYTILQV